MLNFIHNRGIYNSLSRQITKAKYRNPIARTLIFNNEKSFLPSYHKIDIIIPAIERDLITLNLAIPSLRLNLKHPINCIKIIAPYSQNVVKFCENNNCEFVEEENVLPIPKSSINYYRAGWIFQQFLKWSESLSTQEHYFVIDADTILVRPQVLLKNNKVVFYHSDEYHQPYFRTYQKLLGENHLSKVSFISHQMLFQKTKVLELKSEIEARSNLSWYNAILNVLDSDKDTSFSEYETYGNWMLKNYPDEVKVEYWYNLSLSRAKLEEFIPLQKHYFKKYKSVSFHHYV